MSAPIVIPPKPPMPAVKPKRPSRFWRPDRTSMATRSMLLGAAGVGVLAALILDPGFASIAYVIVGAGVVIVFGILTPPRMTVTQWVAAIGMLALLGVAAVRGAEWLVFLCVVVAWVLFTWTLIGGRTWTGILLGTLRSLAGTAPDGQLRSSSKARYPLCSAGAGGASCRRERSIDSSPVDFRIFVRECGSGVREDLRRLRSCHLGVEPGSTDLCRRRDGVRHAGCGVSAPQNADGGRVCTCAGDAVADVGVGGPARSTQRAVPRFCCSTDEDAVRGRRARTGDRWTDLCGLCA